MFICKICNTEMKIGQGIFTGVDRGNAIYVMPPAKINNETLKIVDVWKCPKCGHSKDIKGE